MTPKISSFSIILTFVCLTIIGIALMPKLSVQLNPSYSLPKVSVSFNMAGSSPRTIEIETTSKLEGMLNRISGIEKISSISGNGWGRIDIEFDKHVKMDLARFEVSTIIRHIWPELPENVTYPVISKPTNEEKTDDAFLRYTINSTLSLQEMGDIVENKIKPNLSQLEGINKIEISGVNPFIWKLEYHSEILKNNNLNIKDIEAAISNSLNERFLNIVKSQSLGQEPEWLRVAVRPKNSDQNNPFENISIKTESGIMIPLDKIVEISKIESEPTMFFRVNGLNSVYISIAANTNTNQIALAAKITDRLKKLQKNLPKDFEIHKIYDNTEKIKEEIQKVVTRAGLTLLFLLSFVLITYRNLRFLFLIVASLLINLLISTIFYYFFQVEIQLYSLVGITISMTLILDNIIIMTDHILNQKNKLAFRAILTSSLTTIGSLTIIFFLGDTLRMSLKHFAIVIIINLGTSLIVVLFLIPALIQKLKLEKNIGKRINRKRLKRIVIWFNQPYSKICLFVNRWKIAFILLILFAFGFPIFLLPDKMDDNSKISEIYNRTIGSHYYQESLSPILNNVLGGTLRLFIQKVYNGSYLSNQNEVTLMVNASLPTNASLHEMNDLVKKMESYISTFKEIKQFQTNIFDGQRASILITFTKDIEKTNFPLVLKNKLITKSLELGGGSWSIVGLGDSFSNDLRETAGSFQIEMLGFNYDELYNLGEQLRDKLQEHKRINQVNIRSEFSWFKDDYEEIVFNLNRNHQLQSGVSSKELYDNIGFYFGQPRLIGSISGLREMERIYLQSNEAEKKDVWNFLRTPIPTTVKTSKLADLATVKKISQPQEIGKVNQQYRLCLQFEYIGNNEQGNKVVENYIKDFRKKIPLGYTIHNQYNGITWGGSEENKYGVLFLIFVILFFTSSILFNSIRNPLSIISVIPISYIGIFLAFYWLNANFDQGGFASFILLSGLTINSNIYLINEYNTIRRQNKKLTLLQAYIRSWNHKGLPILLTIISTILGFIPFLLGNSKEGFWYPLAIGTIGGIIISIMSTVLFLPIFLPLKNNHN